MKCNRVYLLGQVVFSLSSIEEKVKIDGEAFQNIVKHVQSHKLFL